MKKPRRKYRKGLKESPYPDMRDNSGVDVTTSLLYREIVQGELPKPPKDKRRA